MAGRIEIMPAPVGVEPIVPISTGEIDSKMDFGAILDGLKETKDNLPKSDYEPISGSARADRALKKTIWESFTKGKESAKEVYDNLTEGDRKDVIEALKKLIGAIESEITASSESGSVQALFNGIFGESDDTRGDTTERTDEILLQILLKIKELKGNSTSDQALSALLPFMEEFGEYSEQAADEAYTVEEMGGTVAFMDGDTTYRMALPQLKNELQELMDILMGFETPSEGIFQLDPGKFTPPVKDDFIPEFDVPDVPTGEIPEVEIIGSEVIPEEPVAEAPENVDGSTEQSLQTIILNNRMVKKEDELKELRADYATVTLNPTAPYERIQNGVDMVSVQNQILENLTAQLSASQVQNSEFRMLLNPGSLGEIAVKIVNNGGEISVSIAAQSESTQKLLESRLSSLVTGLQNVNDNVKEVKIVEANQNTAFAGFNMNSFADGRGQRNTAHTNSRIPQIKIVSSMTDTVQTEETVSQVYKGGNRLWQTV